MVGFGQRKNCKIGTSRVWPEEELVDWDKLWGWREVRKVGMKVVQSTVLRAVPAISKAIF